MTDPTRQGPRADTGKRFVAYIIDIVVLGIINVVLAIGLKGVGSALAFLVGIGYFIYFDGSASGQTLGKRAMGIRVVDFQTGGAVGYGKAAIRYVGRIISAIPCFLGYFWAIWDAQHQAWHDKIAGTVVVPVESYPVSSWP